MDNLSSNSPIGYITEPIGVSCADCTSSKAVPVYRVNILPYSQHCSECNKELVKGSSSIELFPAPFPELTSRRKS